MLNLETLLLEQTSNDWLIGANSLSLLQQTQAKIDELVKFKTEYGQLPVVWIMEADAIAYLASFLAAVITQVPVFLGNPYWQSSEQRSARDLIQPNLIGINNSFNQVSLQVTKQQQPIIGIATGGSSGKIRFAIHTVASLTASVRGFKSYFQLDRINSCCTLPLHHISGLIQVWRSLITGGKLAIIPYRQLKQQQYPEFDFSDFLISLVPTQLQCLIDQNPNWLAQFQTILLGGAPAWQTLLERARIHRLPIATTYGMTETASGVSFLLPEDFLQGNLSSGRVLPHAQVTIIDANGNPVEAYQIGAVKIKAKSLYHGYYPDRAEQKKFIITDDLGYLDAQGYLQIVGRNSQKIITGGENVYPAKIEAAILASNLVKDVAVLGLPDAKWGQVVTAVYIPLETDRIIELQNQLRSQLAPYKQPKYWLATTQLPKDNKGKTNYTELEKLARSLLNENKL